MTSPTSGTAVASPAATERRIGGGLLDPKMLWKSTPDALKKLDPRVQLRNPVMFVVEVGAAITTYTAIFDDKQPAFNWTIVIFLWLTVVFANLAEAVAEGRGKAQAETQRRTKRETVARRLSDWHPGQAGTRERGHAGHPDSAVCGDGRRRDPDPRRPHLLPRARAGTVRRRTALT